MTWTLRKTFRFEASHQLPHHTGKCRNLHGHSWVGQVYVRGSTLHQTGSQTGMLVDYGVIGDAIDTILPQLDHRHLNESLDLETPTSELVAVWIYKQLALTLEGLVAVEIEETCTTSCRYEP